MVFSKASRAFRKIRRARVLAARRKARVSEDVRYEKLRARARTARRLRIRERLLGGGRRTTRVVYLRRNRRRIRYSPNGNGHRTRDDGGGLRSGFRSAFGF